MDEIITCTLLGVASGTLFDLQSNPSGREVWTGVRVRTTDGRTRFFPRMTVEAEASVILDAAIRRGEMVELWLAGNNKTAYPYGIRTSGDAWYTEGWGGELRGDALKFLLIGILTLPLLGIGVLVLLMALGYLINSYSFDARYSREEFDRGHDALILSRMVQSSDSQVQRAA